MRAQTILDVTTNRGGHVDLDYHFQLAWLVVTDDRVGGQAPRVAIALGRLADPVTHIARPNQRQIAADLCARFAPAAMASTSSPSRLMAAS